MTKQEEVAQKALNAYFDFLKLCKTFFGPNAVEDVTDLNDRSKTTATEIAKEFGLDWNHLTPEDSNEIIIALLEDYYNRINIDDGYNFVVDIKVTPKAK